MLCLSGCPWYEGSFQGLFGYLVLFYRGFNVGQAKMVLLKQDQEVGEVGGSVHHGRSP